MSLDTYIQQVDQFTDHNTAKEWFLSIGNSHSVKNSQTLRVKENFVRGCCPHCLVWCDGSKSGSSWIFRADSENAQIKSLCKILVDTYNNLNEHQIKQIKYKNFQKITRILDNDKQKSLQHLVNRIQKIVTENS